MGPSHPSAAAAMARPLTPKANPRIFWRIMASVLREIPTRSGKIASGLPIKTMSPASAARSEPGPAIAIPTSACARAGASLMPSPTMATFCPCACRASIQAALSAGLSSDSTNFRWTDFATRAAVAARSPVSRAISVIPRCLSSCTTSWASGRVRSRTPISPTTCSATITKIGVSPLRSARSTASWNVGGRTPKRSATAVGEPRNSFCQAPRASSTSAASPRPGSRLTFW